MFSAELPKTMGDKFMFSLELAKIWVLDHILCPKYTTFFVCAPKFCGDFPFLGDGIHCNTFKFGEPEVGEAL